MDHAHLKRRVRTAPLVRLGEGPERIRFRAGEPFGMPPHKERDLAHDPRVDGRP